ncbi:guanylate kinase [Mycoplasmoides pneumoniae]|uniref:guanylate kinase n=1 Tax=Mycoplasmoides pneumoniae TaxID=2104 RepID=UPI0009BA78A1|nr:guanylate kinase [Mycoplasmoides pneumoniae]
MQSRLAWSKGNWTGLVGSLISLTSSSTSHALVGNNSILICGKIKIILNIEMVDTGRIFVITGPSGVGKSSLVRCLIDHFKDKLRYSISATTRKMRNSETEGVDYFFKDKAEFEKLIAADAFVEWAMYNDNYYGTLKSQAEQIIHNGGNLVLEIEYQGALQVKQKYPNDVVLIFIKPPSMEELLVRLKKRNDEGAITIQNRLKQAEKECQQIGHFKYVVTNNEFDKTLAELQAILLAEFN